MSITLSSIRIAVRTVPLSLSRFSSPFSMCCGKFTEPRLQTAISSELVFNVISVQRLDECTTPQCCWGERRLQGSLKVIQG